MTPTISETTDLGEQAHTALAALSAKIDMLPDEGDEPRPNERDRIAARRQLLREHRRHLSLAVDVCADIGPRIDATRAWRELLITCQTDLEPRLAESEAEDRRDEDALRQSLRILHDGPEVFPSGELMPNILHNWLTSHGVKMSNGCLFAGRGGLRCCDVRLAALAKEHDTATSELEHWVRAVKSL
ncbi:MAG TPA: hypothetical protein VNJ02_19625 [Vicinamibacterales bacterium]|nr:hypothetical protein [Vicinamibacterales bacterium]